MSLIKSISGIRGTIGGATGDTLNPLDIVKFTTAYATFIRKSTPNGSNKIVVGRDARISGEMVKNVVCGTLLGMGYDVINIGLASTPTTELAVTMAGADGGIIITASHNPRHWNALKLLNNKGEFLTAADGNEVLAIADAEAFEYADVDHIGKYCEENFDERHINAVLNLKLVDQEAIKNAGFRVVVDSINSVGGIILPSLLDRLGVKYTFLNGEANGDFSHNPEPLEKNLGGIKEMTELYYPSSILPLLIESGDIELDEDDYTAQMTEDATTYGYASFEDFEEQAGRGYLTDTYKYTLVLEWLQENNNMVERAQAEQETAAETPAA